jgi:tRNA dimethylallyltransferase
MLQRVVVLAGPTGVGKSAMAFRLCKALNGEIVSADSVQVYRRLDIGSNKPSAVEQSTHPHHMVDVFDPNEECTAGHFYVQAMDAVREILGRGRTPIVCGGTMMYLKWFVNGRYETTQLHDLDIL